MHSAFGWILGWLGGFATALALVAAATALSPEITLDAVSSSQPLPNGIEIHSGAASMRIVALSDYILRVRTSPGGVMPEDSSWAVLSGPRNKSVDVQTIQDPDSVGFRTATLDVRVERHSLRLMVRDLAGKIICADALGQPTKFSRGGFTVSKKCPKGPAAVV